MLLMALMRRLPVKLPLAANPCKNTLPLTAEGPRILLRRLRQVMADGGDRQERLDKIVQLIAASMNTAVCSVYLRRGRDGLE